MHRSPQPAESPNKPPRDDFGARLVGGSVYFLAATFASRLLGLFRQAIIARAFGLARAVDIYYWLHQAIFEAVAVVHGIVTGAFVPLASHLYARGRAAVVSRLTALAALVVLAAFLAPAAWLALAGRSAAQLLLGLTGDDALTFASLSRFIAWYAPIVAAATVLWGALLARQRFAPAALATAVPNVAVLAVLLALIASLHVQALALATLAGGAAFSLVCIAAVALGQPRRKPGEGTVDWWPEALRLASLSAPLLAQALVGAAAGVAERTLLLRLPRGILTAYEHAGRAVDALAGALMAGPLTVAAAVLAREGARRDPRYVARRAAQALRVLNLGAAAVAAFLICFAPLVITLLYRGGNFGPAAVDVTAWLLQLRAPTKLTSVGSEVLIRLFQAQADTLTPMLVWTGATAARLLALLAGIRMGAGPVLVVSLTIAADAATIAGLGFIHTLRGGPLPWAEVVVSFAVSLAWMLAAGGLARAALRALGLGSGLRALAAAGILFVALAAPVLFVLPEERRLLAAGLREVKRRFAAQPSGGDEQADHSRGDSGAGT